MGEAGRKLTIRMPDNPRLRSAEVGRLHLDPGASVRVGSPVMTLRAGRRDHMVRAPRPGKVVPLVASGDRVEPGDPLYILNIDEAALAMAKQGERELVSVEKVRHAPDVPQEEIDPVSRRRRRRSRGSGGLSGLVQAWSKPALAIALYVLACFVLLPILNTLGRDADIGMLVGMAVGSVLFGALIFHLYAPETGLWSRWAVRLVAVSWVGISSLAIFYQQDEDGSLTLAQGAAPVTRLAAPVTRLFAPAETVPPTTAPGIVAEPQIALASGVAPGPGGARPMPEIGAPQSVLGAPLPVPQAHGVAVRDWDRVNPGTGSGEALVFTLADMTGEEIAATRRDAAPVKLATTGGTDLAAEAAAPGALAARPDLSVFTEIAANAAASGDTRAVRIAAVLTEPRPGALPFVETTTDAPIPVPVFNDLLSEAGALAPPVLAMAGGGWLTETALPVLRSEAPTSPVPSAVPPVGTGIDPANEARTASVVAVTDSTPTRPDASVAEATNPWLAAAIPVIAGEALAAVEPAEADAVVGRSLAAPLIGGTPSELTPLRSPELVLVGLQNAAGDDWMRDQTERLVALSGEAGVGGARPARQDAALAVTPAEAVAPTNLPGAATAPEASGIQSVAVIEGAPEATQPAEVPLPERTVETDVVAVRLSTERAALLGGLPAATRVPEPSGIGSVAVIEGALEAIEPAEVPLPERTTETDVIALRQTTERAARVDAQPDAARAPEALDLQPVAVIEGALEPAQPTEVPVLDRTAEGDVVALRQTTERVARIDEQPDAARVPEASGVQPVTVIEGAPEAAQPAEVPLPDRSVETDVVAARAPTERAAGVDDEPAAAPVPEQSEQIGRLAVLEGRLSPAAQAQATALVMGASLGGVAPRVTPNAPDDLALALAPSGSNEAPPWQPEPVPDTVERLLLFLFYDDPRLKTLPQIGDPWVPMLSPDLAEAVRSSVVEDVNEILEVTFWCAAANDPSGSKEANLPGGAYRTAMLADRIRLLQVRLLVDADKVGQLEAEVPVFGDGPSGFFHNKMPLYGSEPDVPLMDKARAYMRAASNRERDRNTPPGIEGGQYFASADALERAMKDNGCAHAIWNDGEGPVNEIGRDLASKIEG